MSLFFAKNCYRELTMMTGGLRGEMPFPLFLGNCRTVLDIHPCQISHCLPNQNALECEYHLVR